ncbi:MAG: PAS domain S-box protein [Chloroherpetonaceae bacterium]|nr:PAS domain S-box protein [Chloroherpetonaceae bacterium]
MEGEMNGRELRILVVNTSAEETHSLAQVWQAAGLPVRAREVRTREALLRALQEERPDVVLNWCLFPELDGVSALQLVHQVAEDIPFVIVGERRGQAAQLCLDAGATAFFEKGEAQKVAEFMRSLCSGLQATQSSEVVAKRKVALLIEPLSLRLRIEKMLQKRRDMVLLPLLRGMSNAPATPDLLIVALNELTPFSSVMVSDLPLFLLASENTETQAIEYLRQGALGYALIENLTEKRLDAALYQAFRWLDLEQRYVQEHQNIKKLNDALDVLEQKCKKLETRCSEMELVLSNEIERAEGLRRELAEQNELFVALAKENEERQFWIEALAQREQRFRKMIEHSSDMIMLLDSQAHILYESSVAERALGYSSEELLGHSLFELVHTSDREAMQAEFLQSIHKTGDMPPMRLRMQHKSGEWRYIELVANNLLHDNAICAIIVNLRDITERVQVEKELQRAKEDFEARVIERTRDLIELSRKLQEEIAARKRVEQTLQQSEDYFWTIFHLSPAAILLWQC